MNTREWALIAFSILSQMAVGSFLVLGIAHFFAIRKAGQEEADRLSDRALLAIGPVLGLGMIGSLFHLGTPLIAPRSVVNLDSSWLSREVFFTVLFGIFGAIFALMQWRKISTSTLRTIIAWITMLFGLAMVFSMSRVYMVRTQPAWNTIATPILFFTTTFLLGSLATGVAFVANYAYVKRKDPGCAEVQCTLLRDVVRGIAISAILLLGVEMVVIPLQLTFLSTGPTAAATDSLAMLFSQFAVLFGLRLILVFSGAGLFALFLYRYAMSPDRVQFLGYMVYSSFVLVLIAEVIGRFLFYATHIRVGI